jgi:hypothetical protein
LVPLELGSQLALPCEVAEVGFGDELLELVRVQLAGEIQDRPGRACQGEPVLTSDVSAI